MTNWHSQDHYEDVSKDLVLCELLPLGGCFLPGHERGEDVGRAVGKLRASVGNHRINVVNEGSPALSPMPHPGHQVFVGCGQQLRSGHPHFEGAVAQQP